MIPSDDGLRRMRAKLSNRIVYNLRLSVSSENIKKWIGQLVFSWFSDILKLDGKNHVSSGPVVKVAVEKFVWEAWLYYKILRILPPTKCLTRTVVL